MTAESQLLAPAHQSTQATTLNEGADIAHVKQRRIKAAWTTIVLLFVAISLWFVVRKELEVGNSLAGKSTTSFPTLTNSRTLQRTSTRQAAAMLSSRAFASATTTESTPLAHENYT